MKVGDKIVCHDTSCFYTANGEIVGETKSFWKVKLFNHKTCDKLWEGADQKQEMKMFYKKNNLNKGYSKLINVGCVSEIFKA